MSGRRERAEYDWRGFARLVQQRLRADGRSYGEIADEIGVTLTDLTRAVSAQILTAPKVIAICDWMQIAVRAFYLRPRSAADIARGGART